MYKHFVNILSKLKNRSTSIVEGIILGFAIGTVYALLEYYFSKPSDPYLRLIPLLIRGSITGILIFATMISLEILFEDFYKKKIFLTVVFFRALLFTFNFTFWLLIVNGFWNQNDIGVSFLEGSMMYFQDEMYLINIVSIFIISTIVLGIIQVNSLHRKGEIKNFILGRYHHPKEEKRFFCFIDLKDSTTIAEELGHVKFGNFLQDYYYDITEAIRRIKS